MLKTVIAITLLAVAASANEVEVIDACGAEWRIGYADDGTVEYADRHDGDEWQEVVDFDDAQLEAERDGLLSGEDTTECLDGDCQ